MFQELLNLGYSLGHFKTHNWKEENLKLNNFSYVWGTQISYIKLFKYCFETSEEFKDLTQKYLIFTLKLHNNFH